jgi:hypothetical protein
MAEREYAKITSPEAKAGLGNVTVRCGPCVQRLGRSAPALAVVDTSGGPGDDRIFRIGRISARQRDRMQAKTDASEELSAWAVEEFGFERFHELVGDELLPEDVDRAPWVSVAWPDRTRGCFVYPKSVELACPHARCRHRPRVRVRDLLELAEQAAAEGRAEVYL